MVPSSSGLGRRPLTPVTRVRTPLGLPDIKRFAGRQPFFFPCNLPLMSAVPILGSKLVLRAKFKFRIDGLFHISYSFDK